MKSYVSMPKTTRKSSLDHFGRMDWIEETHKQDKGKVETLSCIILVYYSSLSFITILDFVSATANYWFVSHNSMGILAYLIMFVC